MKKTYLKPNTKLHVVTSRIPLLGDSDRSAAGDPTNNGLPTGIGETGEDTDPFGGHGQGSGGDGTRAKGFGGWDF